MPRSIALVLGAVIVLLAPATAGARVLHVGPGQRYRRPCQAIAAARPGDRILIDARGNRFYRGDVCACNIYINHVRSFTLRYSYSTDARVGHLVKSRALRNYILYDRLTGEHGTDSYELDLPNGGLSYVIGTVIEQGTRTENPNMLAYGEEGSLNPDSRLYAVNDTFVNDLGRGAAIAVGASVTQPVVAENDVSAGSPVFVSQPHARVNHDCVGTRPGFVDPARYDYRLSAGSRCRRVGSRRGAAQGFSLAPRFQYVPVAGHMRRTDGGVIAGAFGTGTTATG